MDSICRICTPSEGLIHYRGFSATRNRINTDVTFTPPTIGIHRRNTQLRLVLMHNWFLFTWRHLRGWRAWLSHVDLLSASLLLRWVDYFVRGKKPIAYTKNEFEYLSRELRFSGGLRGKIGKLLWRLSERRYEKYHCWNFPCKEIAYRLRVIK